MLHLLTMCDTEVILLTAGVLFLTGFVGDIGTQLFAKVSPKAELFRDYWDEYGKFGAAVIAGLITLVFGGMMFLLALALYEYAFRLETKSWSFVLFATAVGFILGVVVDLLANREDWIPSLRKWYSTVGDTEACLWSGGLTFAFVTFCTSVFWMYSSGK